MSSTFAVVCMMASKPVLRYSTPSAVLLSNSTSSETFSDSPLPLYTPIQVATVVCLVVGIWQVILGVCRLGSLTVLMSDTLISGFTTGASVLVFTSQIKHVFGIKIPRHAGPLKLIYTYIDLIKMINQTNFLALAMTLSVVTILTVFVQCIKTNMIPGVKSETASDSRCCTKRKKITLGVIRCYLVTAKMAAKLLDPIGPSSTPRTVCYLSKQANAHKPGSSLHSAQ
ncbi:hypothetical protein J6590_037270 [Homalodisca vitripennis]|nr:hypothetical protein J6590_037270 [Homalodisca vitripennis]